jgi:hypothetical protein
MRQDQEQGSQTISKTCNWRGLVTAKAGLKQLIMSSASPDGYPALIFKRLRQV